MLKLLIAEDDDDHAELLEMAIAEAPIECQIARMRNGEEALEYLRQENILSDAVRPDLILLDINMPRVNGFEVAEYIKGHEHLRHIPTVMLTTSDAEHDRKRAYDMCINGYLVKPADFGEMLNMMADTLVYWARWNRGLHG